MFVLDPKNGVTFSETSNRTKVEQEKNSNQKYTGVGYIPDYDGYISWTGGTNDCQIWTWSEWWFQMIWRIHDDASIATTDES